MRTVYSAAAEHPHAEHPFPVGRLFAEAVGYPKDLLDELPAAAAAFTGLSNIALWAAIPPGAAVLDVGCGAGLDALIAARRAGDAGRVTGLDFSPAMLARARRAAAQAGCRNVNFHQSDAETLPLPDNSVDVALVNGLFNLNPAREQIFRELGRVVRSGGDLFAAEIVLRAPLPPDARPGEADWFK